MDNVFMVGLQQQRVLRRAMEVVANNVANVSTTGFKADAMLFERHLQSGASTRDTPRDVRFVRDTGMVRDFAPGTLSRTGGTFDLAIEGEGFFSVEGPGGRTMYTRDGSFVLSSTNELVTKEGRKVLDNSGAPIVFDPQGETPVVGGDGSISIAGAVVSRVGVTSFANKGGLEKVGDNLWDVGTASPRTDGAGKVMQGMLESSNVRPVVEISRMIEISRAYESVTRMLSTADDLRGRTIDRLGRASA
jgi:flagellar basal-body rod protein FlgF